jgi:hypothetical protein
LTYHHVSCFYMLVIRGLKAVERRWSDLTLVRVLTENPPRSRSGSCYKNNSGLSSCRYIKMIEKCTPARPWSKWMAILHLILYIHFDTFDQARSSSRRSPQTFSFKNIFGLLLTTIPHNSAGFAKLQISMKKDSSIPHNFDLSFGFRYKLQSFTFSKMPFYGE